ncbi:MAG: hypothetical protein KDC71_05270 [Acidobacteria bacterium]|nr:hypothetical protein [Acidobacteriota bacterium]
MKKQVLLIGICIMAIACATTADKPAESAKSEILSVNASEEMNAKLTLADGVDGQTDHIVSKCTGCALQMAGSDSFKTKVGEYEVHFCSDFCKKAFDRKPDESLKNLVIPQI